MQRVNGTIWERCLHSHIWVGVPLAVLFVVSGTGVGGASLIVLMAGLLFSAIDAYT